MDEKTPETTVCSTMFCYNRAVVTNDPAKPPFCEKCKAETAAKSGQRKM